MNPVFCVTGNIHSFNGFYVAYVNHEKKNGGIYLREGKEVSTGNNDKLLYSVSFALSRGGN